MKKIIFIISNQKFSYINIIFGIDQDLAWNFLAECSRSCSCGCFRRSNILSIGSVSSGSIHRVMRGFFALRQVSITLNISWSIN